MALIKVTPIDPRFAQLRFGLFCLIALLIALTGLQEVGAQATEDNIFGPVIADFEELMQGVQARVGDLLNNLFYSLALIELTVSIGILVLKGAGLQELLAEFVIRILFIGFFIYLLRDGGALLIDVIRSFIQLGATAGGSGALTPDDVIDVGLQLIKGVADSLRWSELLVGIAMLVTSFIVFFVLCVIAANMAVALIEFYIIGYGGFILLAFGGSSWTKGFAIAYLKYGVSVGMKLFAFLLVAGVAFDSMNGRIAQMDTQNLPQMYALAAFVVVLWLVSDRIPSSIQGAIQGVDTSRTFANATPAKVVQNTISNSASSAGGYGAAAIAAVRLGNAQPGNTALNSVRNMASSVSTDIGAKHGGSDGRTVFPTAGSRGGRMTSRMNKEREKIAGSGS